MKTYSDYIDSGVEWMGKIPKGWKVQKIKGIATIAPVLQVEGLEGNSVVNFLPMECLRNGKYDNLFSTMDKYSSSYNGFNDGDIVMAKVTPCFENGNIAIVDNLSNGFGFGTSEIFVIRAEKVINRYLFYYLQNERFKQAACATMYGVAGLKRISSDFLRNMKLCLPTENEQKDIIAYLDTKCVALDKLIATKEEENARLKIYRQSVITKAVTKGLNSDAPMKDSGVEWMGEVPEGWKAERVKNNYAIYNGSTPKSSEPDYWNGNIPWITPAEMSEAIDYINASVRTITEKGLESCGTTLVPKGSIIVSNRAPIGQVNLAGIELCTNQGCKALVNRTEIQNKYIYYCLKSQKKELNALGNGTTFLELSTDALGNFVVPIPPENEQKDIIAYLDTKCVAIDRLLKTNEQIIAKLKEYKQALIYEVVTGKRRVS